MEGNPSEKTGNRAEFVLLIVIFAAPFLAAWIIYAYTDLARGGDSTSYGELVKPSVAVADLALLSPDADGNGSHLHGKWNVIYLSSGDCSAPCRDRLNMLRNLRLALGNRGDRVQIVIASDNEGLAGQDTSGVFLLRRSGLRPAEDTPAENRSYLNNLEEGYYLIDPMGNLMMKYEINSEGAGILRDLKRLLRYSRIG